MLKAAGEIGVRIMTEFTLPMERVMLLKGGKYLGLKQLDHVLEAVESVSEVLIMERVDIRDSKVVKM